MKTLKRIILVALALTAVALIILAMLPSPLKVETARATRGSMQVTIDEEGEARAHDRFVIAAPVAGRMTRIELHEGDRVAKDQVVAEINPLPLDPRSREEIIARVQTAEALSREADEKVEHARADYEQARRERERIEPLARDGIVSRQSLDQARDAEAMRANELAAAKYNADAAASAVREARAGLIAIDSERSSATRIVKLRSPVGGRVLKVVEKSERVVAAGTPIIILGDPARLEVVVDVLSTDAVKIKAGATVLLEGWGGESSIRARVRTIESSAFTKVSALGIEEQRVNIVADFVDPPGPLGDGYRVEARIIIWENENVLKVPSSAVFRRGEVWSVFVIENGAAKRRDLETGRRSQFEVEVINGLSEGEQVILHPSNQIEDGASIEAR
ncbi:MAG: efflux RND transporter periplasmic adaptor subunit [Acidobacteriota bacterium]